MPYLLGLFHWGVCRVSKLGAMSKRKSSKIDWIVWKMRAMSCFVLSFCERMHAFALPIHCPLPKSSKTKHHAEFQIVAQFWNIYLLTLSLI